MSLLPQRKKSAEEIAKLRESLGVPGESPQEAVAEKCRMKPESLAEVEEWSKPSFPIMKPPLSMLPPEYATRTLPAPVGNHGPSQVHSLKRSERMPVLPVDEVPTRQRKSKPRLAVPATAPVASPGSENRPVP
jgi:hypothetical protein